MKRVICFDLFGTLVRSTYVGPTYQDIASEYWPRAVVQQVVVQHLMRTNGSEFSPDRWIEERDERVKDADKMRRERIEIQSLYEKQIEYLLALLPTTMALRKKVEDENAQDRLYQAWWEENNGMQWLPGAEDILKKIGQRKDRCLALVTNVTEAGWRHVDQLLHIRERFSLAYLSFRQNQAKPSPMAWYRIQSWCGQFIADGSDDGSDGILVKPGQFWMIGNNEENDLLIPRLKGWQVILVRPDGGDIPGLAQKILSGGG